MFVEKTTLSTASVCRSEPGEYLDSPEDFLGVFVEVLELELELPKNTKHSTATYYILGPSPSLSLLDLSLF